MRHQDPPLPTRPTTRELAAAAAILTTDGIDLLAMQGGRRFVVVGAGGVFRSIAEDHEVVARAAALKPH